MILCLTVDSTLQTNVDVNTSLGSTFIIERSYYQAKPFSFGAKEGRKDKHSREQDKLSKMISSCSTQILSLHLEFNYLYGFVHPHGFLFLFCISYSVVVKKWDIPSVFFFIFIFTTTVKTCCIKLCLRLDLSRGPLVLQPV